MALKTKVSSFMQSLMVRLVFAPLTLLLIAFMAIASLVLYKEYLHNRNNEVQLLNKAYVAWESSLQGLLLNAKNQVYFLAHSDHYQAYFGKSNEDTWVKTARFLWNSSPYATKDHIIEGKYHFFELNGTLIASFNTQESTASTQSAELTNFWTYLGEEKDFFKNYAGEPLTLIQPNQYRLFVISPVKHNGAMVAGIALEIPLHAQLVDKSLHQLGVDFSGEAYLYQPLVTNPALTTLSLDVVNPSSFNPQLLFDVEAIFAPDTTALSSLRDEKGKKHQVLTSWIAALDAMLIIVSPSSFNGISPVSVWILGVLLGVFLMLSLILYLISKYTTSSLHELTNYASHLAQGKLATPLDWNVSSQNNEIAILGNAIHLMSRNLRALVHQVKESGNEMLETANQVLDTIDQQASANGQTIKRNQAIIEFAQSITSTAQNLSDTMTKVNGISSETALYAESGIGSLEAMKRSMHELVEANESVSAQFATLHARTDSMTDVITTMVQVADQTNMLSLNASIEAKKAGEQGSGFRVVATEIRRLADLVSEFTLEIESMISEITVAVSRGVDSKNHLSSIVSATNAEMESTSSHLTKVIQQVQGLPPRFEMVLQGMESQNALSSEISEKAQELERCSKELSQALDNTSNNIKILGKHASGLEYEISKFSIN